MSDKWRTAYAMYHGKNPTIYVVGAGHSHEVRWCRRFWPNCCIYLFEANKQMAASLEKKFEDDGLVVVIPNAIGSTERMGTFHVSGMEVTSSLLEFNTESPFFLKRWATKRTEQVQIVTLDSVPGWAPDIICIDVQGTEADVLLGAEKALAAASIVMIEIIWIDLYQGGCTFSQVDAIMKLNGYTLHDFYEAAHTEDGQIKWGDVMYTKKKGVA